MKVKEITIGALLTALAIIIPIQFAFLKIQAGPFTATLAAHVPMFLSMLINPVVALMVGVGSALGFLLTTSYIVAARASTHIITGFIGAALIKRGTPYLAAFAITLPIHAILEALVVIALGMPDFGWIVGIGTAAHHAADAAIAFSILYVLNPYLKLNVAKR